MAGGAAQIKDDWETIGGPEWETVAGPSAEELARRQVTAKAAFEANKPSLLGGFTSEAGKNAKLLGQTLMNTAPQASPDFPATGSKILDTANDVLRSGVTGQGKMGSLLEAVKDSPLMHTARSLKNLIPSTERAGEAFNTIMEKAKDVPVNTSQASQVATRAQELGRSGNIIPKPLRDFIRATKPVSGEFGGMKVDMAPDPIRYGPGETTPGGFDLASTAKRLSREEMARVAGTPMQAQVKQFAGAMHAANREAAQSVGMGSMFDQAMKEYRQAKTIKEALDVARKWAPWVIGAGTISGGGTYLARRGLRELIAP